MVNEILKKIMGIDYYRLSKEDKEQIKKEQLEMNISRLRFFYPFLLIINLILLFIDIFKFKPLWYSTVGYRNLYYFHIIIILGLLYFIIALNFKKRLNKYSIKRKKLISLGSILYILLWCSLLSINAQLTHGQISAYIIGALTISASILITPLLNLIIYLIPHIIFTIGIISINTNLNQLSGNIVNSTFLIALTIVIANMNFTNHVNDYINKKIIKTKKLELENSHKNLEKALEKRTEELNKMNEDLIKEIKKRYDSEVRSIKEKLRYEREKEKLNEKIKYEEIRAQFFANISHEFKTPLNVIFSAQQMIDLLIKNDLKNNEDKINKYVKTIKQNCYRLIRLIGNLIDITKIDTGVYEFKPKNIDIVRIVKDITFSVIDYIEDKNISVNFNSTINRKTIACDPDKIERILLNLISNAIKFTPECGKIYINVYDSKDSVYISIKDSGMGIPKDMQKLIFDRFVQVDKTTKRAREGSGIGLSLVKSLVEMHSGEIKLISEKDNGSEFIIRLPSKVINTKEIKDEVAVTSQEKVEKINVEFSDIYF